MTGPNLVGARLIPLPASVALTGPPNLPFFFFFLPPLPENPCARDPCQSRRSVPRRDGVCWGGEWGGGTWSGFVSVERSPLLRGVGRWNGVVKAAVSQLITAANFAELENRGGSKKRVGGWGLRKKKAAPALLYSISGLLTMCR